LPAVLVSEDASHVAVRLNDGSLAVSKIGKRDFTADSWNKLNGSKGVAPFPEIGGLDDGKLECDASSCRYAGRGGIVAILKDPAAAADVCNRSSVVISKWPLQTECRAGLVIDPAMLGKTGALALLDRQTDYEISTVAETGGDRPWSINTGAAIPPDGPAPEPDRP
jgi:competence protein ComEC